MGAPRRLVLGGAGLATIAALAVYVRTLAPTITWRHHGADSGDLVTAAINLGVPHPTGYPLYTMLAHLWARLMPAEPARGVNLLSAVAAALAVGALFALAWRRTMAREGQAGPALAASWVAAGLYATGELLWSQATIAEVYSLHALLMVAVLAACLAGPVRQRPYLAALLLGLALAHHVTAVLFLPALWPYAGRARRWLAGRRALGLGLCLLPGALFYLYVPLRAAAHPVPDWGGATNAAGLWWLISGAAYRRYVGVLGAGQLAGRLSAWAGIWVRDLGIIGLGLALVGLWRSLEDERPFAWCGLTYLGLLSGYALFYGTADSYLYLLPAAAVVALWVARGGACVLALVRERVRSHLAMAVACAILAALPLLALAARWPAMDSSADRVAHDFAQDVLARAAPGAVVISNGDAQTFALWYLRYGRLVRPDVAVVDRSLLAFDWYRRDLAARHPPLERLAGARDAHDAAAILLWEVGARDTLHLTYADGVLLAAAPWTQEGPLLTLSPAARPAGQR